MFMMYVKMLICFIYKLLMDLSEFYMVIYIQLNKN